MAILSLGCSPSMLSVLNALSYLGLKAPLLVVVSVANIILNFTDGNLREIKQLAQGYTIRGRAESKIHISVPSAFNPT